ncbi:MAG: peptidase C39 family protein [Candidatus Micrarchaeota archaeon]|nr:peptidase C39 family protein [Candidatus Micrarchaeota archaeon]MDE1823962.1 peptidase C39 family protein [Candidatus Micrarchaeota archaeon]MDE1849144.1 peptidase C39 family protein [Candidatus Micrarchaeota archaeon]
MKRKSKTIRRKAANRPKRPGKMREKVLFDIPHYPQTEEFTSSAACAMMVLKYLNPNFRLKKEQEYDIWQEAVNGSVWHGSKYGLAYALAKRGAKAKIISNTKDEGYDRKLAVYENVNLDTLTASYNEIKQKSQDMEISEDYGTASINSVRKTLSGNQIPIVLIDANVINPYLESSPHWVVVKGYDKDAFYINDPYSDSTVTLDSDAFKSALGYDNDFHMIVIGSKPKQKK